MTGQVGEWRSSPRAIRAALRYRCAVYWFADSRWWPPVIDCGHQHATAEAAVECARHEAARRNRETEGQRR